MTLSAHRMHRHLLTQQQCLAPGFACIELRCTCCSAADVLLLTPWPWCSQGLEQTILAEIRAAGFTIRRKRACRLSLGDATLLYWHLQGKSKYNQVVRYMSSGPLLALELRKRTAVRDWLCMCGPSDPETARQSHPDSLRARYGTGAPLAVECCWHSAAPPCCVSVQFEGPTHCASACTSLQSHHESFH